MFALAVGFISSPAIAQTQPAEQLAWPQMQFDAAIPTIKSVLGYEIGERITKPEDLIRYFEALQAAAPDRVKIIDYGRTWENRRLIYAIIGTPEQLRNLENIKSNSQALADPRRTNAAQAHTIIANQPAIVWLTNAVHGDEISSSDASMLTAYHLLAAKNAADFDEIRTNTLTIIVPVQNPDGRSRFLANNEQAVGSAPDNDEMAAERDQPWPGGRVNHYNFDLNRDWFAMTQPETQGQIRAYLNFYPQVLVDAHEMSRDESFFFPPEAEPINPNHTEAQKHQRTLIGQNNARWFDSFGIQYFTREIFDGFYPGYGDGWPTTQGSVALTYEQGSARGLVVKRKDGSDMSYAFTVRNQFVASISTLQAAARNRASILNDFYQFRASAISEGQNGRVKSYIIPAQTNQTNADNLATLLARQGVEVAVANASFRACGENYGAGSFIIKTAQPSNRLIRNLLDKEVPMPPEFVARQQDRRTRGLDDEIYDVTAWSLPLLYNVETKQCNIVPNAQSELINENYAHNTQISRTDAKIGYIIPSGDNSYIRFTTQALRAGLNLRAMEEEFTIGGVKYPAGSLVALVSENATDLGQNITQIARSANSNIVAIDNSWVESGPSLGSSKAVKLRLPRVAIVWDSPTNGYSAGVTRFVIEKNLGLNVTAIRAKNLRTNSMGRFDVLVMPDSSQGYITTLGDDGISNLRAYVQNGGTIIGLGGALRFLSAPNVDLLSTKRETATPETEPKPPNNNATIAGANYQNPNDLNKAETPENANPIEIDGAILRVDRNEDHWLTEGLPANLYVMYQGSDIYRPLVRNAGANPLVFAPRENLVASGVVWAPNQAQLALKPFAMVQPKGRGFVIGFDADLTYRAHTQGLNALLLNAIVQSTARANPVR